jgi:hypothetical protein
MVLPPAAESVCELSVLKPSAPCAAACAATNGAAAAATAVGPQQHT